MSNEIKPVCVIQGPIASRSGYGDHCFALAADIIKYDKFDVKIVPMRWGVCPNTMLDDETRPMVKEIKSRILTTNLTSQPELFVQVSIPNEFQPKGKYNIGVTAGIESTVPKPEWIEGLNRMNLNIVPSNFSKEVFVKTAYDRRDERTGVVDKIQLNKPIEVVFEGVDTGIYRKTNEPSEEIDKALEAIPETFCYLFVGHWIQGDVGADRKDVGMLVKIFSEVFKNKKNAPALVLKTSGATFSKIDKAEILKKINDIRAPLSGTLPNIYLIHGELTPIELNRLYNHPKVKAHVSLTHGEGFGRPLLEATLSGKPLLTTGWSGHVDFLPENLANLLPGTMVNVPPSACNEWLVKEGQWFNANYSVAAQKLEDIYSNYINYIPNAEKLRVQNSEKFNLESAGKLLIDVLEKHLPAFEKKVAITLPKFKKITPISS
jgi:glycosyltransferase involved in cell wall biosynthesis